jgi:GDP-L-fucose synthase
MRILVTGASGFLGRHLCPYLEDHGYEVIRLNSGAADLTQAGSLGRFSGVSFDQIYHLAAWTQAGDFCLYHAGEQWIINQQINTNVLAWWQMHQPDAKLVSIGTSCAYSPDLEMREENYLLGQPIDSLFTYAMTKRMLHIGQMALHQQFGLTYLTVIPSTLYGPGYHTDGRQMHFIFDLIRKILRGKRYDEPVVLWGDGYQRREVVFVDDFVQAMVALAPLCDNTLINIGAGAEHTIRDFAGIICRHIGYDCDAIQYDTSRYVGARSKCLNVDRLRQILPDFRPRSLEAGIQATIDWFRQQPEFSLRHAEG